MEIDRPTPRLQVETQGSALSAVCAAAGQDQGKLAGMLGCPGFGSCPSLRWAVRCSCMAANAQAVATAAPGVPAPGATRATWWKPVCGEGLLRESCEPTEYPVLLR